MATAISRSVGQQASRSEILRRLLAGESVVALGAWGMGKTTALEFVVESLRADDSLLIVELSLIPGGEASAWLLDVAAEIDREVAALGDAMWDGVFAGLPGLAVASVADGLRAVRDRLTRVQEMGARIVFVLDDARRALPVLGEGEAAVAAFFRGLAQRRHGLRASFLLSDTPEPVLGHESFLSALREVATTVAIAPMSFAEAEGFLSALAPELDSETARFVYGRVGGHPGLLRGLALPLQQWLAREGGLTEGDRQSLARFVVEATRRCVAESLAQLRSASGAALVDALFAAAAAGRSPELGAFERSLVLPHGLLDEHGAIPEGLAGELARALERDGGAWVEARGETIASTESGPLDEILLELGRKERLIYTCLRERAGQAVPWAELAAAYFAEEPGELDDEERALRNLRAAVNRINGKLAASEKVARSGGRAIRYVRGSGFVLDREVLASLAN